MTAGKVGIAHYRSKRDCLVVGNAQCIEVDVGEIVQRGGFAYADILPLN